MQERQGAARRSPSPCRQRRRRGSALERRRAACMRLWLGRPLIGLSTPSRYFARDGSCWPMLREQRGSCWQIPRPHLLHCMAGHPLNRSASHPPCPANRLPLVNRSLVLMRPAGRRARPPRHRQGAACTPPAPPDPSVRWTAAGFDSPSTDIQRCQGKKLGGSADAPEGAPPALISALPSVLPCAAGRRRERCLEAGLCACPGQTCLPPRA